MDQQVSFPTRHGVPVGWEAFPWGYFQLFGELGIQSAPVVVVTEADGPAVAYAKPGFREAIRAVLGSGTDDVRSAIKSVVDAANAK